MGNKNSFKLLTKEKGLVDQFSTAISQKKMNYYTSHNTFKDPHDFIKHLKVVEPQITIRRTTAS